MIKTGTIKLDELEHSNEKDSNYTVLGIFPATKEFYIKWYEWVIAYPEKHHLFFIYPENYKPIDRLVTQNVDKLGIWNLKSVLNRDTRILVISEEREETQDS